MAKLTKAERDALPRYAFALPETRQYPIEDRAHAEQALRELHNESQAKQRRIRAAVHRIYPDLGATHIITRGRNLKGHK
jgi:hypothetical protein